MITTTTIAPISSSAFDRAQLALDARDHVERVFPLAHDHDARHRLAGAVEIRGAAPLVGAQRDVADILHANRCSALARREHDVLEIVRRGEEPAAAHHVLRAAQLQHAPADLAVAAAHGVDHRADRDVVRAQAARIDVHLVLPHVAAD